MSFLNKRKQELQAALDKLEAAENRVMELEARYLPVLSDKGIVKRIVVLVNNLVAQ